MDKTELIKDIFDEFVSNVSDRLSEESIYEDDTFWRGYRLGVAMILKELEGSFESIKNLTDVEFSLFDIESWQRNGNDFFSKFNRKT